MTIPLSIGPWEPDSPETPSSIRARTYFFKAVEEIEPRVVASLHDDVFINFLCAVYVNFESRITAKKPFDKLTVSEALQGIRSSVSTEEVKNFIPNPNALSQIERDFDAYSLLKLWSEKWHLQEEWCLDYALRTMRMWLYLETQRFYKSWWYAYSSQFTGESSMITDAIWEQTTFISHIKFLDYVGGGDLTNADFIFEFKGVSYRDPGWSPFFQDVGEWKKKVKDEFRAQLQSRRDQGKSAPKGIIEAFHKRAKEHVDFLRSAAEKCGLKVAPRKRDYDHFKWLVHYHVQAPNWSLRVIAEKYNADPKTVSDGIKRTARLIGLTLRNPLPAGRKPRQA